MSPWHPVRGLSVLPVLLAPVAVHAQPARRCPSAAVVMQDGPATARWATAVTALRGALDAQGHPWSCTAARVELEPAGTSLRADMVTPDGRRASRRVDAPGELRATVEAMLITGDPGVPAPPASSPRGRHTAPAPAPAPAPAVPGSQVQLAVQSLDEVTPAETTAPAGRLVAGMDGGLRGAGPAVAVMLSVGLHAGACLGHGCFTAWARYDAVVAGLDSNAADFDVSVISGGVSAAWAWALGRGSLEAGPTVSVAGVVQSLASARTQRAETVVQPRLGATVRWRSRTHGVGPTVAVDAEGAPGSPGAAMAPRLPGPPAWSVGASAGFSYGGPL